MQDSSKDFLGTGWHFPPTFAANGDEVEMVSGIEDIQQSLEILFSTRLRERLYHDDFGADLSEFLFEEIDGHLLNNIERQLGDAILYYEPRISLEQIEILTDKAEEGLLHIRLIFSVPGTNSRYNMVYPFYLNEGI